MPADDGKFDPEFMCAPGRLGCQGSELCSLAKSNGWLVSISMMERGERLPEEPGACMRFRVVRSGVLATCAVTPDGRRQILCLNLPGDVVCPMSAEGTECWCEALTPSQVCKLDFSAGAEQMHGTPAYAAALFRLVHDRLERSSVHVVTLGRLDGMERLCGFLAEMTRRIGRQRGEGWEVSLPMSREDIADYLGLNTDTVSRLMTRIKKAGLARFPSPTEYEVPDLQRLESRVPFSLARGIREEPSEDREAAQ